MEAVARRDAWAAGRSLAVLLALSACVGAAGLLLAGCSGEAPPATAWVPPAVLSDTGLYADPATHRVAADVLSFTPQYPLWTDGAHKERWIRLPPGAQIDASNPDAWDFPVGTKFWKEFGWERRVETRYIERTPAGWRFATYLWTDDGSDALLAPEAGVPGAYEFAPGKRHDLPGRADCRVCHEAHATPILGFSALQLSPDRDPLAPHAETPGPEDVDLSTLDRRGLLRGTPVAQLTTPPRIEAPTPRARAALGYLHANCGTCHAPTSPVAGLGLDLEARLGSLVPPSPAVASTVGQESRFRLLVGSRLAATRIVPGAPEESVLWLRLSTRDPLRQMPPLGTHAVDVEGAALVEAWIREDLASAAVPAPAKPLSHHNVPENSR